LLAYVCSYWRTFFIYDNDIARPELQIIGFLSVSEVLGTASPFQHNPTRPELESPEVRSVQAEMALQPSGYAWGPFVLERMIVEVEVMQVPLRVD
jgi:hypothetical protein